MAVRYIDSAYVDGHMEPAVVRAALGRCRMSLNTVIEEASGSVRGLLRSKGYGAPETLDPSTVTDTNIKLATMAAVRQFICGLPTSGIKLPDNWETHPENLAYVGIYNGRVQPDSVVDNKSTPGGWGFAAAATDTPSRLSADDLKVL